VGGVPIKPDTKDWTWVLQRRCPECGFEAGTVQRDHVGTLIREIARAWRDVLIRDAAAVRARPSHDRWSALEYGCHVRDVFRRFRERLTLLLTEEDPIFADWDQDRAAIEDRYHEQDPARVAEELQVAARKLADAFDIVAGAQWQRTGGRADGARFTVESFARYLVHDSVHHLHDANARFSRPNDADR
jgi:DinB superfamily